MTRFIKIFSFATVLLFSGCVSLHNGTIQPTAVVVTHSDFKVIETVVGTSEVLYVMGIGGFGREGLVKEAKQDLYRQIDLKPGQMIANVTLDFKTSYFFGPLVVIRKAIVSAEILQIGGVKESRNQPSVNNTINEAFYQAYEDTDEKQSNEAGKVLSNEQKIGLAKSCTDCRYVNVTNIYELKKGDLIMHKDSEFGQTIYGIVLEALNKEIKLETYPAGTKVVQSIKFENIRKIEF